MDYIDPYRARHFSRALPGGDGLDGMAGMGAQPGTALPPAAAQQRAFVRLPNGVIVDPQQIAAAAGAPVPAVLAASLAVWRARSVPEAQVAVDQVERAYGLRSTALQAIADSKKPVVVVPAASSQMRGMGNIFGDIWDKAEDVASDVYDFAKDKVLPVAADVAAFPVTGFLGYIAPPSLRPDQIVQHPTAAAGAAYDGFQWLAKSSGTLLGKTIKSLGTAVSGQPAQIPPAVPAAQQAGILGSLGSLGGGSLTPWLLGGAALGLALIFKHNKHT